MIYTVPVVHTMFKFVIIFHKLWTAYLMMPSDQKKVRSETHLPIGLRKAVLKR
jgi:hypothetical protein